MLHSKESCILKFEKLVDKLFERNWITAQQVDGAKVEFEDFINSIVKQHQDKFAQYNFNNACLNEFLGFYMIEEKFQNLWHICQYVFTLSHRQSQIKHFNFNKEMHVENLEQLSHVESKNCVQLHDFQ